MGSGSSSGGGLSNNQINNMTGQINSLQQAVTNNNAQISNLQNIITKNNIQLATDNSIIATGTTALSVTSTYQQYFTGSDTQTVTLPTTSIAAGQQFQIVNTSTGAVTVQSSGSNTVLILAASTSAVFTALKATPTAAADWGYIYNGVNITSAKVGAFSNSITIAGTDGTTMTFPGTSKTVAANDGSNMTVASQATGDLFVSTSDTAYGRLADVAANSPLLSGGLATLPAYASWTMGSPSTAGNYLRSDGTNWYSSGTGGTLTVATTPVTGGTSTYVLYDNAGTLGNYNISGTGSVAMTSQPTIKSPVAVAVSASASTGTTTFDISQGGIQNFTFSGSTASDSVTFAISNPVPNQPFIVSVTQNSGGSGTVTWWSTIRWAGGSAPTLTTTASKRDTFGFIVQGTAGTGTYDGFIVGQNV